MSETIESRSAYLQYNPSGLGPVDFCWNSRSGGHSVLGLDTSCLSPILQYLESLNIAPPATAIYCAWDVFSQRDIHVVMHFRDKVHAGCRRFSVHAIASDGTLVEEISKDMWTGLKYSGWTRRLHKDTSIELARTKIILRPRAEEMVRSMEEDEEALCVLIGNCSDRSGIEEASESGMNVFVTAFSEILLDCLGSSVAKSLFRRLLCHYPPIALVLSRLEEEGLAVLSSSLTPYPENEIILTEMANVFLRISKGVGFKSPADSTSQSPLDSTRDSVDSCVPNDKRSTAMKMALEAALLATRVGPGHIWAWTTLAEIRRERKEFLECIIALNVALNEHMGVGLDNVTAGISSLWCDPSEKVIENFDISLQLESDDGDGFNPWFDERFVRDHISNVSAIPPPSTEPPVALLLSEKKVYEILDRIQKDRGWAELVSLRRKTFAYNNRLCSERLDKLFHLLHADLVQVDALRKELNEIRNREDGGFPNTSEIWKNRVEVAVRQKAPDLIDICARMALLNAGNSPRIAQMLFETYLEHRLVKEATRVLEAIWTEIEKIMGKLFPFQPWEFINLCPPWLAASARKLVRTCGPDAVRNCLKESESLRAFLTNFQAETTTFG